MLGRHTVRSIALVLLAASLLMLPAAGSGAWTDDATAHVGPDDRLHVTVPVDVVLVGFETGTAQTVGNHLEPEQIRQAYEEQPRPIPPDPDQPALPLVTVGNGSFHPTPTLPTADYQIHQAPASLVESTREAILDATVPGTDDPIYDANQVETHLAKALPAHGFDLDPRTPTLVVLHGGDALPDNHAYRVDYPSGHLQPVRVFGERYPLLVMDASAKPDPYAGSESYDAALDPGGPETVDALVQAVQDATRFRLLESPIYPPTTRTCHAVTVVLAVRAGAQDSHLGVPELEELFDPDTVEASLAELTAPTPLTLDVQRVDLPQDDPALATLTRGGIQSADATRAWLEANWDRYWVPHEGCEAYVSLVVLGDAGDTQRTGIALYDPDGGKRVSLTIDPALTRTRWHYEGAGEGEVNTRDPSVDTYDTLNHVLTHETGHLVGQRHTLDYTDPDGFSHVSRSFSSVWSPMSYQVDQRTTQFGVVDQTNLHRNRAGFLVQRAIAEDRSGDPLFDEAMTQLGNHAWRKAGATLKELVHG